MLTDLKTLWTMARGQDAKARSHAERLDAFYGPQAAQYDRFREGLLVGRDPLLRALPVRQGSRWVDMGGGTGRNAAQLQALGKLAAMHQYTVVDLCEPLLAVARERARALPQVNTVLADATRWQPTEPVDGVLFSYSLTMVPDWYLALDNALAMLKPGGILAVADFYAARRFDDGPSIGHDGLAAPPQSWFQRHAWPLWFAHDGVHISRDHLPYLRARLQLMSLHTLTAPVPYLPFTRWRPLRVPHYVVVGSKPR